MERRKVLLIVAAGVAALGTLLVFMYVRTADNRAAEQFNAVKVLRAVKVISPGETVEAAQQAGKIEEGSISAGQLLPDALTTLTPISGKIALTTIYPGEQIISSKFGDSAAGTSLTIPKGKLAISVNLSDPNRVAGFVNPGDNVVIFNTTDAFARMLLPSVQVIGVGTTTVVSTTKTDAKGAQTTDQLPRTLLTIAVSQPEAERVLFANGHGELAFGLLDADSKVTRSPGVTGRNLFN